MSYISISTNQPTEGQRELTEREPANLRNDFKVPIEINTGDTIELVSIKFSKVFRDITLKKSLNFV